MTAEQSTTTAFQYDISRLPEFKSHKRVKAVKISHIENFGAGMFGLYSSDQDKSDPSPLITVTDVYMGKHKPVAGMWYVLYADGYESASPAQAFEEDYLKIEPMLTGGATVANAPTTEVNNPAAMTFGSALLHLEAGRKVARAGWNGKGMWLMLVPSTPQYQFREGSPYRNAGLVQADINPHIDMMTASGQMQPGWLASQTDMLAKDWLVVP